MDLAPFQPKWHAAIQEMAEKFCTDPAPFDPSTILQAPEEFLTWTPDREPTNEEINWLCKRTSAFLFVAAPFTDEAKLTQWRDIIADQLALKEFVTFEEPERHFVCTARRFNKYELAPVSGALRPEDRIDNIRHNIKLYSARVELPQPENGRRLIMLCYGPSLTDTWEQAISEAKYSDADIATNSGAHDFLAKRNIMPKFHVEIDPREERAKFSEQPNDFTEYMIASVCHPSLTDKLAPYKMRLFHLFDGRESDEIVKLEPKAPLVAGGSCVALRSMRLFYHMGYRVFSIYGFDCSFKDDMQWAAAHPGKAHKIVEAKLTGSDRIFLTSRALETYANQFLEEIQAMADARFYLHGDGLLQEWCKVNNRLEAEKRMKAVAAE